MPTLDTLQLPRIDTAGYGGREAKKIASHLYQVEEQLRYVLGHLDEDNLSEGLKAKIESGGMGSEILQTLDAITLRASGQDDALTELRVGLTGITAAVQEQGGSISSLQQTAEGIIATVEQNKNDAASALQQTADRITATVAEVYSTREELTSTVEQTAGSILSTVADGYTSKTELRQTLDSLTLAVENGETASTLRLQAGEAELSSADITLTGVVTFKDLAEESERTVINGSNITTGEIVADLIKSGVLQSKGGTTRYDLEQGSIQMGADGKPHIYIDKEMVRWYVTVPGGAVGPTGIFYSVYGYTWVGSTSRHNYFGWITDGKPAAGNDNHWFGLHIDNQDNRATFNTGDVYMKKADVTGDLGVGQTLSTRNLEAWGTKDRVVPTGYGTLGIAAMESPAPVFCDLGGGVCDADGVCLLALDERYLAVTEPGQTRRWVLTDTDGSGPLWAEDTPAGAAVHGAPGQHFDWLCLAAQKGTGGEYAELRSSRPPWLEPQTPDVLAAALALAEAEETNMNESMEVLTA